MRAAAKRGRRTAACLSPFRCRTRISPSPADGTREASHLPPEDEIARAAAGSGVKQASIPALAGCPRPRPALRSWPGGVRGRWHRGRQPCGTRRRPGDGPGSRCAARRSRRGCSWTPRGAVGIDTTPAPPAIGGVTPDTGAAGRRRDPRGPRDRRHDGPPRADHPLRAAARAARRGRWERPSRTAPAAGRSPRRPRSPRAPTACSPAWPPAANRPGGDRNAVHARRRPPGPGPRRPSPRSWTASAPTPPSAPTTSPCGLARDRRAGRDRDDHPRRPRPDASWPTPAAPGRSPTSGRSPSDPIPWRSPPPTVPATRRVRPPSRSVATPSTSSAPPLPVRPDALTFRVLLLIEPTVDVTLSDGTRVTVQMSDQVLPRRRRGRAARHRQHAPS